MFYPDGEALDEPSLSPDLIVDDDPDQLGVEHKQEGKLAWGVYQTYWAAVGGALAVSILMSLLLMQGFHLTPVPFSLFLKLQMNSYIFTSIQPPVNMSIISDYLFLIQK